MRCVLDPLAGPTIPQTDDEPRFLEKLQITAIAMFPPALIILSVLGSLMFGLAAPSEAAALGCVGAIFLNTAYRRLNIKVLKESLDKTLKVTTMIMFIILAGNMFTGVFIGGGGGKLLEQLLQGLHFTPFITLSFVLFLSFLAGFVLDWISVLLIFVPVFVPIISRAGFDKLWICVLFMLIVQTSYLTPPMAPAIFYFRAIKPDAISTSHVLRGVVPFIILQLITLGLVITFPQLVLWF